MKLALLKREMPKRASAIAVALIAAASVVAGRERPAAEVVEPKAARAENPAPAAAVEIDLARLQRAPAGAAVPGDDPFAPRSFARAPAAAAPAARAEAPKGPPPLPFAYAGKLIHDGRTEVFVQRGDELISIAAGQNIDAEYRVDSISDSSIGFTYLPLKKRQSLEREAPG
jgi:hypothetical protein